MGRPLRLLEPGTFWFVTSRCSEARFLLRPDPQLVSLFGLHLARAAQRFPSITLFAALAMGNHLHLLVLDSASHLSSFMESFLGNLAKAVNRLRRRSGHVFERRFSAEPVLDDQALRQRLLYLVLNPVAANLVERHDEWPGLCLFNQDDAPFQKTFRWFNRSRYEAARRLAVRSGTRPDPQAFYEEASLVVHPLPARRCGDSPGQEQPTLLEELRLHEGRAREQRLLARRRVLGKERIVAQSPLAAPASPRRGPRPLCHTASMALYRWFRDKVRQVQRAYAAASAAYRRGAFTVEFPPYLFRPTVPCLEAAVT